MTLAPVIYLVSRTGGSRCVKEGNKAMALDYFSAQAAAYKEFRPGYPEPLFEWLASIAPATRLAWDCGCGNGQASASLARRFERVIATDVSEQQLALAAGAANLEYRSEPAEQATLDPRSVDLVFVGQAIHWFDHAPFYQEVRRVARPGAALVAVTYNLLHITPALDALIDRLYHETLGGYWPPARRHVETGYRNIPFPFPPIEAPVITHQADWNLSQLLGYFDSWSAVAAYRQQTGADPLASYRAGLLAAWGDPAHRHRIRWPLSILAGVVTPE